ncbi:hypothetical protein ABVK25_009806 [Lepraria finkii]|uniref:Uncharacterized protein n=1 Tax=Lepraria finkii TaxID=1340010 RepID=A0ABR4AZ84_9LECA
MDSNGEMEFLMCQGCGALSVSLVIHMPGLADTHSQNSPHHPPSSTSPPLNLYQQPAFLNILPRVFIDYIPKSSKAIIHLSWLPRLPLARPPQARPLGQDNPGRRHQILYQRQGI